MCTLFSFLFVSCGGDDENLVEEPKPEEKEAVTGDVVNIDNFSATVSGQVNLDYYYNYTACVEYYTEPSFEDLTYFDVKYVYNLNATQKSFEIVLDNLLPETTYYYRVHVEKNEESFYGETKSFTTKQLVLQESGAIDLGLSVKWAAYNLGANRPEQYGSYIEWGETTEKESFTYYNPTQTPRYADIGEEISGTEYDAARAQWGASWRMPTRMEYAELVEKCESKWAIYKGVYGQLFIGSNGNRIFLPAAGYKNHKGEKKSVGEWGHYWSGTIGHLAPAFVLVLESDAMGLIFSDGYVDGNKNIMRTSFVTVRPVTD